jgi:hypothetical protein
MPVMREWTGILVMSAILIVIPFRPAAVGVHTMEVWSGDSVTVPSFFLYAAEPLGLAIMP